mmetsp:Transcript_83251/g.231007  ORF Transcript_83251/g.231007 Transcript_83251/m.231007 type:complete len:163 (-) Transcript_83251:95-583(-)
MACFMLSLALFGLLAAPQGARADLKSGRRSQSMDEEFRAFDAAGASLDTQGWQSFLSASSRSARSAHDSARQSSLDAQIAQERALDIAVSDDFAEKLDEQAQTPSLRELAREHWAGIQLPASQKAAKPPQRTAAEPPKSMPQAEHPPQASLRTLLMSAGRTA